MKNLSEIILCGGGNVKNCELVNYTDGYMVGVSTIAILDNTEDLKVNFSKYLQLSNYMNIGFWFNEDNRKWYVDFSENIKDLNVALLLASERGELAIWNCAAFEEIRVA